MSEGVAHLFGDYVAQSDWMANEKTGAHLPAAAHALTYAACFLPVTRSWRALAVIGGTHFVIDRWRLARYVVWAKNQAAPARHRYPWSHAGWHGYHSASHEDRWQEIPTPPGARPGMRGDLVPDDSGCVAPDKPDWLAGWLMIVADNALHLAVNRWALTHLPKKIERD